jgi:uncharacterized RDD family membrane protein YckC/type II secretory pathway pseudopilin PulG
VTQASIALQDDIVPAGFVRRWAAFFLDSLILSVGFYLVFFVAILAVAGASGLAELGADQMPAWFLALQLAMVLLYFVAAGLYYALQESSIHQATIGKRALGIKVVDREGRRLRFAHALGRWAAAALSYLTFYIGFLMAAFTARKQALHDLVAGTEVVDQWAYTAFPERQRRGLSGCLVVFLLAAMMLPVLAVLAAIALPAYQDYVVRAQVVEALSANATLKQRVTEFVAERGECPWNDTPGFSAATGYASARVRQVELHALEDGRCALVIDLVGPASVPESDRWIELALDPQTRAWSCRSALPDRALPANCRG